MDWDWPCYMGYPCSRLGTWHSISKGTCIWDTQGSMGEKRRKRMRVSVNKQFWPTMMSSTVASKQLVHLVIRVCNNYWWRQLEVAETSREINFICGLVFLSNLSMSLHSHSGIYRINQFVWSRSYNICNHRNLSIARWSDILYVI